MPRCIGMFKSLLTSLVISAFALGAQAKPIPITSVPYTIVAPGNYQVVPLPDGGVPVTGPGTSITINVTVPGKVVLDLNGAHLIAYFITEHNVPPSDCIDVFAGSDITIENGSIGHIDEYFFATGIYVNPGGIVPYLYGDPNNPLHFAPSGNSTSNAPGSPSTGGTGATIGKLTIDNVFFRTDLYGLVLAGVSGATIKNCDITAPEGPYIGFWDYASKYGNTYINNSFSEVQNPFIVSTTYSVPVVQQRAVFVGPTPTP
jgi:hypothetical protein